MDQNLGDEAIAAFNRILTEIPESHLSDLVLKKKAEVYELLLGQVKEAQKIYEELLTSYPNSIYIEEVRKKIRSLEGIT
jgi:tetratricopeptide (TPR) repeat protein